MKHVLTTENLISRREKMNMEHLHMAIEGFGAKHEDLVKNPRFSLMSRLNPRFVFKPDKFVGFRCSGYILLYTYWHNIFLVFRDLGS